MPLPCYPNTNPTLYLHTPAQLYKSMPFIMYRTFIMEHIKQLAKIFEQCYLFRKNTQRLKNGSSLLGAAACITQEASRKRYSDLAVRLGDWLMGC